MSFFLWGVASDGNPFPHTAPPLLEGRDEGLRSPGMKTVWRSPGWCPEMRKTGCQGLLSPLCHCRHRWHWWVTRDLLCPLARWLRPSPIPHLKVKTSNHELGCAHHHRLYRMLSEPLTLLISQEVRLLIPILQRKKLRLREILQPAQEAKPAHGETGPPPEIFCFKIPCSPHKNLRTDV